MAIEINEGSTAITGEHIHLYREAGIAQSLALEVNLPGLKHKVSVMNVANAHLNKFDLTVYGGPVVGRKRTKKGVLAEFTLYLIVVWGWTPTESVTKALGGKEATDKITRQAAKITAVFKAVIDAQSKA